MTRTLPLIIASLLLLPLASCASAVDAEEVPAPPPPASTPSTDAAPEVLLKPEPVFGGDCASVFDAAGVSAGVGAPVALALARDTTRSAAIAVLGGMSCTWTNADEPVVWLTVIPADGLDDVVADAASADGWCYGSDPAVGAEGSCSFSSVVSGYWLAGVYNVAAGSGRSAPAGIDALELALEAEAAVAPPAAVGRTAGTWTDVPSCEDHPVRFHVESAIGEAPVAVAASAGGEAGPGLYGALRAVGDVACIWRTASGGDAFATDLMPGAGWLVDERLAQGATAVPVTGAVAAALSASDPVPTVVATDGVNLVEVTAVTDGTPTDDLTAVAAAMLAGAAG